MKTYLLIALAGSTLVMNAGDLTALPAPSPEPTAEPWIKPTLNVRARYEFRDVQGPVDSASAFTTRERVGLLTTEWYGLSAFVEGEFTQAIVDDYDSGPGAATFPDEPGTTAILDPETNELNRAWLQYSAYDSKLKIGRQRILLDNTAFVGNVGWRQNEQTFDGASLTVTAIPDLTLFYSYLNRVNRIFGSDATGGLRNFAGDIHLANATYKGIEDLTLTGYGYFMDFDEIGNGYISNNTVGTIASTKIGGLALRGEVAFQAEAESTPGVFRGTAVDDAWYLHLDVDYTMGDHTIGIGWEYLDADFVTPLATVHAFNGFADVFIGNRIGLGRNPGLSDVYVSHKWKTPFWGINFTQFAHLFGDNNSNFDYGWEYDAVLAKKFNENFKGIIKFAYYDADTFSSDTTQVTVELNYNF